MQITTGQKVSKKSSASTSVRSRSLIEVTHLHPVSDMTFTDHCIDALREYIQCHVDLTPIHLVWSKNKGGILPDFTQPHTCRNFRQAHEWILRRNIANFEHGIGDKGVAIDAQETLEKLGWS
jgi:hypothetical protein